MEGKERSRKEDIPATVPFYLYPLYLTTITTKSKIQLKQIHVLKISNDTKIRKVQCLTPTTDLQVLRPLSRSNYCEEILKFIFPGILLKYRSIDACITY